MPVVLLLLLPDLAVMFQACWRQETPAHTPTVASIASWLYDIEFP